jgi:hypothetical protein
MSEKNLHLHFMFVWNIQNQVQKDSAIIDMEKSLSAIGVHGGNVQICVDPQLSRAHNSIPRKPSLNGIVANRLFQSSTWSGKDRIWKDVCKSEHNFMEQGRSRIARVDMWKAFEDIQPYLIGLILTLEQRSSFKEKVEAFGRLYIASFGKEHITHYMVSCFIHCFILLTYISFKLEIHVSFSSTCLAPCILHTSTNILQWMQHNIVRHVLYFVEMYSSLSLWSCQGMEKSHHAAKMANQ